MRVLVPFGATDPKTRLGPVLDAAERRTLSELMLRDVVEAVRAAGGSPYVVSTEPVTLQLEDGTDVEVRVDDRPLSVVVNDAIEQSVGDRETDSNGGDANENAGALAVVVADLALVTPDVLSRLFDAAGDLVVAPGRGVGTNALVIRDAAFSVDYHGTSFLDHLALARAQGIEPTVFDSFRLAIDVDEPTDLVEVFVHGDGRARTWLRERFELSTDEGEGRVGLNRL